MNITKYSKKILIFIAALAGCLMLLHTTAYAMPSYYLSAPQTATIEITSMTYEKPDEPQNEAQIALMSNEAGWYRLVLRPQTELSFYQYNIWDGIYTSDPVESKQFNQSDGTVIDMYINMRDLHNYLVGIYFEGADEVTFEAEFTYVGTVGDAGPDISSSFDEASGTMTLIGTGSMWDDYDYMVWSGKSWGHDIKHLIIGEGITRIGNGMFSNQYYLEDVSFPATLTEIGAFSFGNIGAPDNDPDRYEEYPIDSPKCIFQIPEGVLRIDSGAFAQRIDDKILLPKSITEINGDLFIVNSSFCNIYVYKGTYAESYAKERGYNIGYINEDGSLSKLERTIDVSKTSYTKTYGDKSFSLDAYAPMVSLTYKSSDKNVVTVDKTGKVTIKGPGKAKITITAPGDEDFKTAKKTVTITVKPKGTTISAVTALSKGFTVKWKKQATKTTGYQIRYSLKSSMSGAKTVTISKTGTVSKKITGLKAKKKYFVQIRTYKTVSGTKYYSAWSAKKSVTTKK